MSIVILLYQSIYHPQLTCVITERRQLLIIATRVHMRGKPLYCQDIGLEGAF